MRVLVGTACVIWGEQKEADVRGLMSMRVLGGISSSA